MFRQWLHTTLSEMYPGARFDVLVPPDAKMGDYSTNIALVAKKNAQEVCDALAAKGGEMIDHCQVAGPGFVNIFLKDEYLRAQMGKSEIPQSGAGQKIIVEYCGTNIAKPMHVGHLRSTIIGDALARIYKEVGYEVVRWNYLGDWGTQFGKLIAAYRRWGNEAELLKMPIATMLALYIRFHDELKTNPELEKEGQEEFRKLEAGDVENRKLWQEFRDYSLKEFDGLFAQLGISFDVTKGESAYEDAIPKVIDQLTSAGLLKKSEGADIVELDGLPPALIRKSDGASLYITRDIASLEDRIENYHAAKILYVVANQQALHFEQLFAIKEKLGLPSEAVHVKFGMVLGEDGKKLATREGKVVLLQDVIDEVVRRAGEKNPETAHAIGIAALKYNDLRQHPYSDITFDWDAMLDLGGNSGPYLQYTYARLASIVAKAGPSTGSGQADLAKLDHPVERAMMRHMLDFGHAVAQCVELSALNGLALHLYQLATLANRYYEEVHINADEDVSRKAARLQLISAVMAQMKKGLDLLGIQTLERI